VSFAEAVIQVRRTWTCGKVGWPKKQSLERPGAAASFASRIHVRWKRQTPYSQPGDWVFPSFKLKGQQPRVTKHVVEDYLAASGSEGGHSFIVPKRRRQTGR